MRDRIRYWLRAAFRHAALEREMHDEMQLHLDRRVEALVAAGMRPEEARMAARREFGNPAVHQDADRDARRTRWVDSICTDVRFALRYFVRKPLSSATIVLILALGIGGHAFQLSLLLSIIKRPPPGLSADLPLVRLRGMYHAKDEPAWHPVALWYAELREVETLPNTFAAVAAWTSSRVAATVPGKLDGDPTAVQFVTDGFFKTLGLRPTHGPGLPAKGEGPQLVGVISDAMWEDVFDRGDVAGQIITLNGVAIRVVGVAPPEFTGASPDDERRVMWLPLSARAPVLALSDSSAYARLDSAYFNIVGLLRPGVSTEGATAEMHVVTARVAARMVPPPAPGTTAAYVYDADVVPLRGLTVLDAEMTAILSIWTTATLLVLIIVCTNVSGLVISSAVSRRQEIAIRLSLGASRGRVIRQLLTESILLALAGAALGLLVYRAILTAASRIPEVEYVRADLETVGLTILVAAGAGILSGITPAFHATRLGVSEVLKSGGTGATRRSRVHQAFVVAQVLFTQPLLVFMAFLIVEVTPQNHASLPSGVPDHVLQVSVDQARWTPGTYASKLAVADRLVRRLAATPGVVQVMPDADVLRSATLSVRVEDRGPIARAGNPIHVDMMLSKPGYFALLGVPLVRGNDLPPADTSSTAIISSDLAHALWGGADPIGRHFKQLSPTQPVPRDIVVSGVYDSRFLPGDGDEERVYRAVKDWAADEYLVRTAGPGVALADTVRRIAREELPTIPIDHPMTLAQVDARKATSANNGRLAAIASATLVLLLSSLGLYGIVALSVGERRREIGVRTALGARGTQVVALFYRSGVMLAALGLVLGLPLSLAAARFLPAGARMGGVNDAHLPSLLIIGPSVAAVVLIVASIATLIPASRAATVDPITALRSE
ncbi:MAG TPA: ABC transporter permease [Gemmatimonadaceae bacterium]|nr:ABC transporter permease [Gemmatimonadaceae bacterium]